MKNFCQLILAFMILCSAQKSFSQSWNITGNTGTTAGTNFIGTTDAKDFVFKTNNIERGRIVNTGGVWRLGTSTNNCKIDSTGKLSFAGTGVYQVGANKYAFQYSANPNYGLFFNSTSVQYEFRNGSATPLFYVNANNGNGVFSAGVQVGNSTVANAGNLRWSGTDFQGYNGSSWVSLTTGTGANTALSNLISTSVNQSLIANANNTLDLGTAANSWRDFYMDGSIYLDDQKFISNGGTNSTFIGNLSGSINTGTHNVGVGMWSLQNNLGGGHNTSCGSLSMYLNTSGGQNTAVGYNSLGINSSGSFNTAIGDQALYFNTGSSNTSTGAESMLYNSSGTGNTANGYSAMNANTTGSQNVAIGNRAMITNTTGSQNVMIGNAAGYKCIERSGLVIIGDSAGFNNNPTVGSILSGAGNIFIGKMAGFSNTFGFTNTAVGTYALYSNVEGINNTAFGLNALAGNTYGGSNVAIGSYALSEFNGTSSTDGGNTVMGDHSMQFTSSGNNNVAIGLAALSGSSTIIGTGSSNVAVGAGSMVVNTTGSWNVAVGISTLRNNSTGYRNVAIGDSALSSNISGVFNTASGYKSLSKNISSYNSAYGYSSGLNNSSGAQNTFVGYNSGIANTTGSNCTFLGASSGGASATTNWNTFIGALSGSITTRGDNCFIGEESGTLNTTGSQNTLLGNVTNVSIGTLSNATAIGYSAAVNATNKIRFGNSAVTVIEGTVAFTVSDGRFKTNITDEVKGLEFINELKPVVYNFEAKKFDNFLNQNSTDEQKERMSGIDYSQAENIRYSGFIAQDVEAAAKKVGYDFNGVHVPEDANDNYSLAYAEFVVPLVKSVQELSVQIDSLKNDENKISAEDIAELKTEMQIKDEQIAEQQNQIQSLNSKLDEMMNKMNNFETSLSQCCSNYQGATTPSLGEGWDGLPSLEQNIPNPFMQSSYIKFYIPSTAKNSSIMISDLNGRVVKTFQNISAGFGTVNINGGELAAGNYEYTLFIDGNKIDTKQMVLTK